MFIERYVFSGSLTRDMVEYLKKIPDFKPIDVLVSQVDKSGCKNMLEYLQEGVVKSFLLDSGAYSVHKGNANPTVDEYIDYANSMDKYCWGIAQLDTIPGEFGKAKTPEDYVKSAEGSWENYLYMRPKMISPEKLIPVFHQGEDVKYLLRMIDWRGPNGEKVDCIGLSPSNDRAQKDKNIYLANMYDVIANSSNPKIKTHLFGCTSFSALLQFPCYSADSISHRLQAAYVKCMTRKWSIVSISDKTRSSKTKSNYNFLEVCDKQTYKEFEALANSYNLTIEQLKTEPSARVVFNIMEIQKALETREFKLYTEGRPKKLW